MATGEVQVESESVRVTKWTIQPNDSIPSHRHDNDYVVVPLSAGSMYVIDPHGVEMKVELSAGASYARSSGAEHSVENRSNEVVVFVEVERL